MFGYHKQQGKHIRSVISRRHKSGNSLGMPLVRPKKFKLETSDRQLKCLTPSLLLGSVQDADAIFVVDGSTLDLSLVHCVNTWLMSFQ